MTRPSSPQPYISLHVTLLTTTTTVPNPRARRARRRSQPCLCLQEELVNSNLRAGSDRNLVTSVWEISQAKPCEQHSCAVRLAVAVVMLNLRFRGFFPFTYDMVPDAAKILYLLLRQWVERTCILASCRL
ncbi:hypothetical protein DENSPDRAFT_517298 [Dentipellis sp. KUC8613]|nr:hypothetical protein DENSPDRAFT_517298 [Dentipellis sp. KUC8613]